MKAKILIPGVIAIIMIAITCSKDDFSTTPKLTFKSVNTTRIEQGPLIFTLEFNDKNGDLSDTVWFKKTSYTCPSLHDSTQAFILPNYPTKKYIKGEMDFSFDYNIIGNNTPLPSGCGSSGDDSCYFQFWIRDKANHMSDTVKSPDIVLLQ